LLIRRVFAVLPPVGSIGLLLAPIRGPGHSEAISLRETGCSGSSRLSEEVEAMSVDRRWPIQLAGWKMRRRVADWPPKPGAPVIEIRAIRKESTM
jgi:hypothetical protein